MELAHFSFVIFLSGTAGSVTTTASGSTLDTAPGKSAMEKAVAKNMLVMSGGEGYIDFRAGQLYVPFPLPLPCLFI